MKGDGGQEGIKVTWSMTGDVRARNRGRWNC